jgi:fluoroquinolone transport system permease protein
MNKVLTLIKGDLKNIYRDSIQLLFICVPVIIGLALRLITPIAKRLVMEFFNFDISPHFMFIMSLMIQLTPMMLGAVTGFLMLDERDNHILEYIQVTPFSKKGYVAYRIAIPTIVSFFYVFLSLYLIGLAPFYLPTVIPIAFMVSLQAPMATLFLPAFAKNKVEGIALFKLFSIILIAPIGGYLFDSVYQYFLGIVPNFWVVKAFLMHQTPDILFWLFVVIGIIVHCIWIAVLAFFFLKRVE